MVSYYGIIINQIVFRPLQEKTKELHIQLKRIIKQEEQN